MTATAAGQTWSQTADSSDIVNESDFDASSDGDGALVDDSMDIDMAVTSKVQLDVKPEALNYEDMDVGSRQVKSERGFTSINLQNTGSEYIDTIWVEATTPSSDPFRTGESTNAGTPGGAHDAGNFLQIKPQIPSDTDLANAVNNPPGDNNAYHAINRKEFAIGGRDVAGSSDIGDRDQIPDFINADASEMSMVQWGSSTLSSGENPHEVSGLGDDWTSNEINTSGQPDEVHVGSFRVANRDYYYALLLDGDSPTSGELRVADASFEDNIGTTDNAWDQYDPSNLGEGENVAWHDGDTFGVYDFTDEGAANEPIRYRIYQVQQFGSQDVGYISGLDLRADGSALKPDSEFSDSDEPTRTYDVLIDKENDDNTGVATLTRTAFNPIPDPLQGNDANEDMASSGATGNTDFIFNQEGGVDQMLEPGQSIATDLGIEVPRGVVQGQVETGTLSVLLTSDNSPTPGQNAEEFIHTDQ